MIYIDDIEKATLENTDYRRVIYTSKYSQLVLMSIPVGEEIEMEIHPNTDQFFRFEQGQGEIIIGGKTLNRCPNGYLNRYPNGGYLNSKIHEIYQVKDGSGVIIPYGTYHRVVNTGDVPLKLYSIYSPPHHPIGLVQKDKIVENRDNIKKLLLLLSNF